MNPIEIHKDKITALCEVHKVKELYAFGSVLNNKFNDFSDIDFLIQFHPIDLFLYFDNYMDLKEKFEKLFNRPVDLVERQAIRNPIFKRVIEREKKMIYGRESA